MDLDVKKIAAMDVKMSIDHIFKLQMKFPQQDILGSFMRGISEGKKQQSSSLQEEQSQPSSNEKP